MLSALLWLHYRLAAVTEYANINDLIKAAMGAWRPPPRLKLSEWADQHFYLSEESAAEPGRWKTLPYQKGILDAITDPNIEQVWVMKSARVGWTKCMGAAIGYHIDHAPCPMLVVQPTVDDAKGYSKEEIAPMLRDCPSLSKIIFEDAEEVGPRDSGNTILHKKFPGGILSMVGANSGAGFRRISRKVVLFDEIDGYPPSAGSDGDQIKLGIKRSEFYWDRKALGGSTPLIAGQSRIEDLFSQGDQRRYFVPCSQCGHMDFLVFRERTDGQGHFMQWPEGRPEEAHFVCSKNGCTIRHKDKREIVTRGEWRAGVRPKVLASGRLCVSFHVWAAYSFSPNASWGQIASEFLDAKSNPEKLKTFVNTVLGETWKDRGDAPDWERIYQRREPYPTNTLPEGVIFLTAGVDVQKDRCVYEVVGWGDDKRSWSIDSGVIPFDTSNDDEWIKLDALLSRTWPTAAGIPIGLHMLAVDSGAFTQHVYNWARRHPMSRVIATKGVSTARVLIGTPTPVDVTVRGKRIARGYKVWPIGVDIAKSELYGWLKLPVEEGKPPPPGYCHFPEYGPEFFKQLTAEQLVPVVNKRKGYTTYEWHILPNRENHFLDARILARAAACLAGLDRLAAQKRAREQASTATPPPPTVAAPPQAPAPVPAAPPPPKAPPRAPGGWLGSGTDSRFQGKRGKGWLR